MDLKIKINNVRNIKTKVPGMEEMLGKNNEFGIVVDGTDEDKLHDGLKVMISSLKIREKYRDKAMERSRIFSKENTVSEIEKMFESMMENEA